MKNWRRTIRIVIFSLTGLFAVLIVGGIVLSRVALRRFESRLAEVGITLQSLNVNLLERSVTMEGFEWHTQAPDSALRATEHASSHQSKVPSTYAKAARIRASSIDVWRFIRNKEIQIGSIVLSNVKLVADHTDFKGQKKDDSQNDYNLPFTKVSVNNLVLEEAEVVLKNDSLEEYNGTLNVALHDIVLSEAQRFNDFAAYTLGDFKVTLNDYHMNAKESMYTLSLSKMNIDSRSRSLILDSLVLLPKYGKYQFSRRLGKQFDRFVLRVPSVELTGLDFNKLRDSTIHAGMLKIDRANLYVFRDKRLPFTRQKHNPLPVALIRSFKIGFALDSLILENTKITYEEFPEKGFETGHIVFDNLQAHAAHLTNRDAYPTVKHSVLHVTSNVMEHGKIKVDFTIPYENAQIYNATGRISDLSLERLNTMFESLAFVHVESGKMNTLDFNFDYNDYTSRGNIVIDYEDLKLVALKKEKEKKENSFKSLVLGLFVRKDKDREVSIDKRMGKIYYERDRRKAIFNVWVRSLFSGVKSSVIDPIPERKPETRKERREELREDHHDNKDKKKNKKQDQKTDSGAEKRDSVESISPTQR
jgi:hypothetical protein